MESACLCLWPIKHQFEAHAYPFSDENLHWVSLMFKAASFIILLIRNATLKHWEIIWSSGGRDHFVDWQGNIEPNLIIC